MCIRDRDGDLHIIDLKGLDYDDEKWDKLLSQITLDEATNFIQLGGSGIEPIASIDLIGGLDADGPNGIIDAFGGKVLSTYWKSSESDDPTYVSSKDENASYECGTFPTEPTLAATFNKELAADQGDIFAEDSLWTNITTIYAPGLNLQDVYKRQEKRICLTNKRKGLLLCVNGQVLTANCVCILGMQKV